MNERIMGWGGGAVVALAVIGVIAFLTAVTALFSLNLLAAGVAFVAAAIAFTGIANVVFRH
jgi:hypothetical protein